MIENPYHGDPQQNFGKSGPFFKRRQTWLVMVGLLIFCGVGCWAPLSGGNAVAGLTPPNVRIGLGIFACAAHRTVDAPILTTTPELAILRKTNQVSSFQQF
jgi:hypothetical protein